MGLFDGSSTASNIAAQLIKHPQIITFNSVRSGLDVLFDQVYLIDPRLIGCVAGWEGNSTTTGSLGINKKFELKIRYDDFLPADFSDVVMDNGVWRPFDLVQKELRFPPFIRVITKDEQGLLKRVQEDIPKLEASYFGPLSIYTQARHKSGEYICIIIQFTTKIDQQKYETWQKMAKRQVASISQSYLGGKTPPPFIRVFLALSYLQQTCNYDDETAALISVDPTANVERQHVFYPYGPICRGEGVCEGISGAFKMLMDYNDVVCQIVSGQADGDGHKWNIVQLDGMYYHVDPTAGISGDGVYVGGFLKTDKDMTKAKYTWDTDTCPSCLGRRYNYFAVEDYIEENGADLLNMGIDPTYLMPNNILI